MFLKNKALIVLEHMTRSDKLIPIWVTSQKMAQSILKTHPEYFEENANPTKIQYELNKILKGLMALDMVEYKGKSLDRSYKLNNLGVEYYKLKLKQKEGI